MYYSATPQTKATIRQQTGIYESYASHMKNKILLIVGMGVEQEIIILNEKKQ